MATWPENPRHPIYRVLRMGLVLGSLTAILALNASHFDITEIKALAWTFFSLIGIEGIDEFIHKIKGHGEDTRSNTFDIGRAEADTATGD